MASDLIRVTGMNSGLDTESIISAYTSTAREKVKDAKNSKTINEWTQDAWKSLNSKIYGLYSGTLSTNRLAAAYSKTKVTTSNSALTVVAGQKAVNGIQTAKIAGLAKAAYLTGAAIGVSDSTANLNSTLGIAEGQQITLNKQNGESRTIQIGGAEAEGVTVVKTMDELTKALGDSGLNASFDSTNQRLFLSAKATGSSNDFNLSGDTDALAALGLATKSQLDAAGIDQDAASKIDGSSAKIILNGAEFVSDTNTFNINGTTYTVNSMPTDPEEEISITTGTDYDAIYDVVKDMLKEYNSVMNEMSKLYNADPSKGYEPLTEEQKESMSDSEIEVWENKIKDALLRSDDTVYDVMMTMVNTAGGSFEVGGKKMFLSDFGISTLGYYDAEENERYALHIDGDADDSNTASKDDKLRSMIATDPEAAASFFSQFSQTLYTNLYSKMGSTKMSSIYKVYNDKQMKEEHTDWEKKITELESKLSDMEDNYYKKFSAMETALAKMSSNQNAVSSLLGGN